MKQFTLLHEHRHGATVYTFKSDKTLKQLRTKSVSKELVEFLNIEFDFDDEDIREAITIDEVGEIPTF